MDAGRILHETARWLAIAGGLLLCLLAALVTLSVTGRSAFSMPVPGDFELVAIGTGTRGFRLSALVPVESWQRARGFLHAAGADSVQNFL